MVASGVITAVPLLLFGASARRLPLTTLGTLQFLAPILQFIVALTVFNEPMPPERLVGFCLVWVAVILLCIDMASQPRRDRAARAACAPAREQGEHAAESAAMPRIRRRRHVGIAHPGARSRQLTGQSPVRRARFSGMKKGAGSCSKP